TPAATNTRSRFLSAWLTMKVNIVPVLSDLIEKFGALDDNALAGGNAVQHQHTLRIKRLHPDDARRETFGRSVLKDDGLAVAGTQHASARKSQPLQFFAGRGQHRHQLADTQAFLVALDGEMHRYRLAAIGEPRALERESELTALAGKGGRGLVIRNQGEGQSLNPQAGRIDDLKHDGIGFGDLAGDRIAGRDSAWNRGDQPFRLATRLVERCAALAKALQFSHSVIQSDFVDDAGLRERLI